MALVETIGYPVEAEAWTEDYVACAAEFGAYGTFTEPAALTAEALTRFEFDHIGDINGGQIEELKLALEAMREGHPREGLPVRTTKVLIKSGTVLLGIDDDETLTANQFKVAEVVNRVTGVPIGARPMRNNIRLGTMVDKSQETYRNVIRGFNDRMLPERVTLGPILGVVLVRSSGDRLSI